MNYAEALKYIDGYTDYEKLPMPHDPAFYDLRRVELLMSQMGEPHLGTATVHITGTKGKGSTAAMTASVLDACGYRTGLYTSPHLLTIRERFRVNGKMISEAEFAAIVTGLKPLVERINADAVYGELTTFEILTAIAFAFFKEKGVDFQVLEVGMGGTYDATNIVPHPDVCVITPVSLDHTEVLGDTLGKIAAEKGGIIKQGCTVVLSPQEGEAAGVIEGICRRKDAALIRVGDDIKWRPLGFDEDGQSLQVEGRRGGYNLRIPLLGDHQLINAAAAVAVLEVLGEKGFNISPQAMAEGLSTMRWEGRFQVLGKRPFLVVDGAHNPDSARRLVANLRRYLRFRRAVLVIGVSGDKDVDGIVAEFAPNFHSVIVTRSRHPRSLETGRLKDSFRRLGVEAVEAGGVPGALTLAEGMAGEDDLILATGSLFVVAEAIEAAGEFM